MKENPIEDEFTDHDVPRSAEEIARRAIALHCVIAASHGVSREDLSKWLKQEELWDALSPIEEKFLRSASPTTNEVRNATWRVEAQVALLWAISKIESMSGLSEQCDTGPLVDAIPDLFSETEDFIRSAVLRDREAVHEEYERVYNAHWKARDAVRRGVPIPDSVDLEIVQERHYGFNWLIGYEGLDWDQITTDT